MKAELVNVAKGSAQPVSATSVISAVARCVRSVRIGSAVSVAWLLAVLTLVGAWGVPARAQALRQAAPAAADAQPYDLQRDEQRGGHTLARHIGRTDEQLAQRLRNEPNISAASTWTDELTARRAIGQAVHENEVRIQAWASRQGSRPNLVLNYVQRTGPPLGRSLRRGQRVSAPCDRALVVLRWQDRDRRWIVLTSYPETRR